MRLAREWMTELAGVAATDRVERIEGRGGAPTVKVGGIFLHSRYDPWKEAAGLIDGAGLDLKRPILVIGAGLGYHVCELVKRGATVAAVEFDPEVARLAVEGPLRDSDVLLGVGEPDAIAASEGFRAFAAKVPQVLIHPPSAQLHPQDTEAMAALLAKTALGLQRLRVAIVGPMYGGSLPIAGYLERGFRALGHTTLLVDNSAGWPLYCAATEGVKTKHAAGQLGNMLTGFLAEWSYARVTEFAADVCVVIAQAPAGPNFPARLAKDGVATAFWYVENWRHLPYWKDIAPHYDVFFHIQPGEFEQQLERAGCRRHAYVQTGCDPEIHKPVELSDEERETFSCDLSFAGAGYVNRVEVFKGLTDYRFKIWGGDWHARELQARVCRPGERFTPEMFARIVAGSKINLNLHSSTSHPGVDPQCDAVNPRVFEIAACGGFQLCDPCIGLDGLFDFDTELPAYRSLTELRSKIDHFLAHPEERQAYAARARARALADHTYAKRAQQMLDVILEACGTRILMKGVRVQRTVSEMAGSVGRNTPLGQYLASLPPDLLFTQENINAQLTEATQKLQEAEKIFVYLREVRNFAETLLGLR